MLIQAPKGTRDILPSEIPEWKRLEDIFFSVTGCFGYREIRTPVFEYADIFNRSVGETTDIVQKEMYVFSDKGGREFALRPEGTAGIVRSYAENGLGSDPSPLKLSYNITAYRYENVAKGRYREFRQFGIEAFGAKGPLIDAEMVAMADMFLKRAGISRYGIEVNSIGCASCRPRYNEDLREYFGGRIGGMCGICSGRLEGNPLRILDCKEPGCRAYIEKAPSMLDYLCDGCRDHFTGFRDYLDSLRIRYKVNDRIVRGLDYYTKTVFEFVSSYVGAQGTVCGGGRYDGLVGQFCSIDVPAAGFALGVDRLNMQLKAEGTVPAKGKVPLVFIASIGEKATRFASRLSLELRSRGIFSENDTMDRSIKAQMKYADRIGARYVVVIGDDELQKGIVSIRDMKGGESRETAVERVTDELIDMGDKND